MYINLFGSNCYFDEKSWVERMTMTTLDGPPWRIEDIIAIQHQMKESEDRIFEYMRQTATPDPIEQLRKHLDEMIAKEHQ